MTYTPRESQAVATAATELLQYLESADFVAGDEYQFHNLRDYALDILAIANKGVQK